MKKRWLIIDRKGFVAGFILICLVLMGAGWGSCWQYRQTEINELKVQNYMLDNRMNHWIASSKFWRDEYEKTDIKYKDLQQHYFALLDYSSNQTVAMDALYDKYQALKTPVIKEVIVDRYPVWKNFESIEQVEFMFKGSVTPLAPNVCLPIAISLQEAALNQGYRVSVAFASNQRYYGRIVTDAVEGHAGLLLQAGDSWYFVDPVNWRVTKLW